MQEENYICRYYKPDCVSKTDKEELDYFNTYFQSKKGFSCFPFCIFSNQIPDAVELENLLTTQHIFQNKIRPLILILKKKETSDFSSYWNLLLMGIDDVIEWTSREEIVNYLESKYARNNIIKETADSILVKEILVGDSLIWKNFIYQLIETILFSQAPILLIGESGTGKELISRLIHALDKRADKKKLVVVDCTTIVPELSGCELFGHERGSYTNAIQSREGAFALANNGTLFLDEIGELPMNLQAELLRVLQEGMYKKVGSNSWQKQASGLYVPRTEI